MGNFSQLRTFQICLSSYFDKTLLLPKADKTWCLVEILVSFKWLNNVGQSHDKKVQY